jgi:hypothetical protein
MTDKALEQRLKIALDETRMTIMGVQIFTGFQFQAVVQEGFDSLPPGSKACLFVAILALVIAVGFLAAPAALHRLVYEGEAVPAMIPLTTRLVALALGVLALGFSLDVYIGLERVLGLWGALAAGLGTFAATSIFWCGPALLRPGRKEITMGRETEPTPLSKKIDYMLTEARVLLPGAQALLGFQLIAVLTKKFEQFPPELKIIHAVGMAMLAIVIILLLAPAAYHRLAFKGNDAPEVHKVGSLLVTLALVPLALGIAAEVVVATAAISGRIEVGVGAALLMLVVLLGLWYAWPLAARARS